MLHRSRLLLLLAVLAVSCSGNGGDSAVDESIAVEPDHIEAVAEVRNYSVELKANCSWSASVSDEDGNVVSWAVPNRTAGKGDASVTVRVLKNPLPAQRTAKVVFSSPGGKRAALTIVQDGAEDSGVTSADIRVGTFNLRISTLDSETGDNGWSKRRSRLMSSIRDNDFDIFGMNETDETIRTALAEEFSDTYTFWYFSPYRQSGVATDKPAQGIAFKTSKFVISDKHYFWASDNPDEMSLNDKGNTEGATLHSRGACCAMFTHKASGAKFFFMVNHGILNDDDNAKYAQVYIDREKMYNPQGLPSIFVGDMNCEPSEPASITWKTWWNDVYELLPSSARSGPDWTFNAYVSKYFRRIDFIYVRGDVTPLKYRCNDTKYGGFAPSDHFPIWADVTIPLNQQ